jgi:hypothetical protein
MLGCLLLATSSLAADEMQSLQKTYHDGNYQQAFDGLREWLLEPAIDDGQAPAAFELALNCLSQLNRIGEWDSFRELVVSRHPEAWRLLAAVAQSYYSGEHYGYLIAGEFQRGRHRGGGKVINATARDRARALQLYHRVVEIVSEREEGKPIDAVSAMLQNFAGALQYGNHGGPAWRLQTLTDLGTLPDYEEGWGPRGSEPQGAPVDEDGKPVYFALPESWDAAENDGERWRWVLEQLSRVGSNGQRQALELRAQFLREQFGVQTLARYGWLARSPDDEDEAGTWSLHTLTDDETIARLATGVERFTLPDEHNFIKLYQQLNQLRQAQDQAAIYESAVLSLANIYEDRRQYPRAAEYWKLAVAHSRGKTRESHQQRLDRIAGNWGEFEPVMTQPAGSGATVEFRFRNGRQVEFTAHQIDVRQLLADTKAYLKSNPQPVDYRNIQIGNLGYRLVHEQPGKYVGAEVARWNLPLEPRDEHFDRRITVTTPLQKAGAYLVTAKMADGNTSKIILWLADTAIVRKPLADKTLYYVADAVTGAPLAKANVEFFGYWQQHLDARKFRIHTDQFAELTDANGQAFLPVRDDEVHQNMTWIATVTADNGRLAYLGFSGVWYARHQLEKYSQTKVFTITDRPVYRPNQTVEFKFWIGQAEYDQADRSRFAHQSFQVEIYNPKNEKVFAKTIPADNYGGIAGEFDLPVDATLGQYQLRLVNHGGGSFRVEEYKKPEFEVTVDAPTKPVALGETVTATIRAKYYFGSPVTSATVKYKVLRTNFDGHWYPPSPWDWLYGEGFWWFSYDYDWHPGWARWGCPRPAPWWFWRAPTPPEVVAEREAPIGPDGTVEVEIDTSLAEQLHGDHDHNYQIQAEVVDESRRTIVGSGRVLVARAPFKVFAWVDRGHYRVGDTVTAHFAARRLDGEPVAGKGKLKLLKLGYDGADLKPIETEVRNWDLATKSAGHAEIEINASQAGQYRLAYTVTDAAGHTVEGGYVFTIRGEGFDGREFRFADLELIPDRQTYAPEQKVRLQVNTNRTGSSVLLFLRPAGGAYLPPQLLRLDGKSTMVELDVTQADMPNFFVEAVTVADGRLHTEAREIHVPPEKRVLNVEVVPTAKEYLPGQKAEVKLKLSNQNGEPYVGSTVLAIYDKSVEYISGGSNVADIKEFFWKWRRNHQPQSETNLERWFANLVPPGEQGMENIGIFGGSVADDLDSIERGGRGGGMAPSSGRESKMAFGVTMEMAGAPAPAARLGAEMADDANLELLQSTVAADAEGENQLAEPTVRSEFADTALWVASLETGADGLATAELEMPENLTTWKVRVWAMGHGTRVGEGSSEIVTRKNLIVRMQAPRFFVQQDEVVLSANVHNYLPTAKQVEVRLELDGGVLQAESVTHETVEIEAGGEKRVDWRVRVLREGKATVRMLALTDEESDAVEMSFPAHVHGMLKTESYSGVIRPQHSEGTFEITVPADRQPEQTRLEVRYSPTLAGAMVDALPYLIDYPYGCTEQTLNRFLPAVITQQTLLRMKVDLAAIQEKRTNLNAQEIGDDRERAAQWQTYDRNPVFDEAELSKVVKTGVKRLTEMQLGDGGWGWFSGFGEHSTAHTTAIVVRGLRIAQANDVALVPGVLERGVAWLEQYQREQLLRLANVGDDGAVIDDSKPYKHKPDNLDALVYMVLADADVTNAEMREYLYTERTNLAVYGLAMLGLSLHKENRADELAMVMRNLRQYVVEDDENQTAYLNMPGSSWWYWYGSEYEAHAYYLRLLSATDPKGELAPKLVKYLLNNRKHATYWNSTRDTALVVEAFADFLEASGEDQPEQTVEVWIDGQERKRVEISSENLFSFDNQFVLTGAALEAGRHTVELRKQGSGPLYYNGYLTNFTLEDDIRHAGLELKVNRRYYRLRPVDANIKVAGSRGQAADQRVEKYRREPITNLGKVESGELVEVELVVESKNDYEYILLEDMKAAGFEPVDLRSGYRGNELGAYMELRDDRVSLFVRQLARGTHSVSYRMRAEIPGQFSALPTKAYAMYAPELKGNSDEIKVRIED